MHNFNLFHPKIGGFNHGRISVFVIDKRESRCYLNYEGHDGQNICSQELGSPVTKSTCCCSIGRAWGSKCELCPAPGSEEHSKLCPGGSGYKPNVHSVSRLKLIKCKNVYFISKQRGHS